MFRNVDQVHDMMDNIAEQQDVAKEIADAISNPVALGGEFDEDDLEKELEALEQEALEDELINISPSVQEMPDVPKEKIAQKAKASKLTIYFTIYLHEASFTCF